MSHLRTAGISFGKVNKPKKTKILFMQI